MQLCLYTVSAMNDQVLIKHLGWIENNVLWVTSTFHATQSERSQCHEGSSLLQPAPASSSLPSSHCSAQWCSPSNHTCWIVCCFVKHWIRWVELDTFSWHRCRQARGFQSLMSPRNRPVLSFHYQNFQHLDVIVVKFSEIRCKYPWFRNDCFRFQTVLPVYKCFLWGGARS